MVDLYNKNPSALSRILEIATQDLKALTSILEARPYSFAIDLAALAARREILNLEKWLQDKINDNGNSFVKACIAYLKDKEKILKMPKTDSTPRPLDNLAIFYNCLQSNRNLFAPELLEELQLLSPKFQKGKEESLAKSLLAVDAPSPSQERKMLIPGLATPGAKAASLATTPPSKVTVVPPSSTLNPSFGALLGSGATAQGTVASAGGSNLSTSGSGDNRVFPPEVEELANAYFQISTLAKYLLKRSLAYLRNSRTPKSKRNKISLHA